MCMKAKKDKKFAETVGQLCELLPNANIAFEKTYDKKYIMHDHCLCCVDFEETAKQNGLKGIREALEFIFE